MKSTLLFFFTFMFYITSTAQLSEEYIKNYKNKYNNNIPKLFIISESGDEYAYLFNNEIIHFNSKNKLHTIGGNKPLFIYNKVLFFLRNDSLYSYTPTKNHLTVLGKIKLYSNNYIYTNNTIYIPLKNKLVVYNNVTELRTIETLENEFIIFKKEYKYHTIINGSEFISDENIISISLIENKIYALTYNNLLIFDYSNKYPIETYPIEKNEIEKIKSENYRFENIQKEKLIFSKENKSDLLSNSPILLNNLNLSILKNIANRNENIVNAVFYKYYNFKDNQVHETNFTGNEFNFSYLPMNILIIYNDSINTDKNYYKKTKTIINLYHLTKLNFDSISNKYENFQITQDGEFLYYIDNNKNLCRYSFKKNETINTHFKILKISNDLTSDLLTNLNLELFHYDLQNKMSYINSDQIPIIIDSIGNVTKLNIPNFTGSKKTYSNFCKIINKDNFITVTIDELMGEYQLNLVKNNENIIEITRTHKTIYPLLINRYPKTNLNSTIFFTKGSNIIWTETSLSEGTTLFKYDINKKLKNHIPIIYEKIYDTLQSKYFAFEIDNRVIKGGIKLPKNYKPDSTYPAIITNYLTLSNGLNILYNSMNGESNIIENYTISGLLNELNLLHQGYIIVYIDIPLTSGFYSENSHYINFVIKNILPEYKMIDLKNIGLLGHSRSAGMSFGALVLDSLIKCSIVSNGIFSELLDLTNFREHEPLENRNISRFTHRLRIPPNPTYNYLSDLKDNFTDVSNKDPFFKLDKLNTATLFMINDLDNTISATSGYFTFIKTQLLKKNTYLLNFLDESHILKKRENAEKAYDIFISFLNFYLKNGNNRNTKWVYK